MAEATSVHSVPTDAWGIIISHLDAKNLASLRATSRHFRDLVDHFAPEVRTFADEYDATVWMITHRPQSAALDRLVLYTAAAEFRLSRLHRVMKLLEIAVNLICVSSNGPEIEAHTLGVLLMFIMIADRTPRDHPHLAQAAMPDTKIALYRLLLAVARIHFRGRACRNPTRTTLEKDLRDHRELHISRATLTPFEGDWDTDYHRLLRELREWGWWDGIVQTQEASLRKPQLRFESHPSRFAAFAALLVHFVQVFGADDSDAMEQLIPRYYNKYGPFGELEFGLVLQRWQRVRDLLGANHSAFGRRVREILSE